MGKKYFRDLTTFKIGGEIKYYREVKNENDLLAAASFAEENNLPIFILGGGSDILVSDRGFDGLVIKYTGSELKVKSEKLKVIITAEAGAVWDDLVALAVKNNLQGMECLSGIPGTVGASPVQNIGAYGQEMKDTLEKIRAFDLKESKFVEFENKDCGFDYRESIFKKPENWQRYLFTSITFKLKKYEDTDLSLQNIRDEILRVRKEKLENPKEIPNAGSFFKNPIVEKNKIAAGMLIDKAGWKGKTYKNVGVSAKNALILVNPKGKGTAKEIKELADKIIKDVFEKFGVTLEPEVQFINI